MAQGDRFFEIAALMASAAIFVASCAMVLAGWNARSEILAWWVLLAFQLLFVLVAMGTSVALSTWLVQTALAAAVNRVAALERSHGELMRAVTRRAPTGVAIAFLTGQVLVLIADKAFPRSVQTTVIVCIGLCLGFWVANELQIAASRAVRATGWVLWHLTLLFLPAAMLGSHGWSVTAVVASLSNIRTTTLLFAGIAFVTLVCAPLVVETLTRLPAKPIGTRRLMGV